MAEDDQVLQSPLHARHVAGGAVMGNEAGWAMPLSYQGVLAECQAARSRAAIFDVSHIGRIRVRGDEALALLERVCTADVVHQEDDTALYTLMCNKRGGIIDQCFCLRLEGFWLVTTSPINRLKVLEHLRRVGKGMDVKIDDQTEKTAQVCVTGPAAAGILDRVLPEKPSALPAGGAKVGTLMIARYIAMRTDYGGQWSLEVVLPNMVAGQAWDFITRKAGENNITPAGLAAWDVLRIEAALPRYGQELNETIDPITAGLVSAVDFEGDFIGAEALRAMREKPPARRRAGLVMGTAQPSQPPSIPRMGASVLRTDGSQAGTVTSGTFSPARNAAVALAYLAPDAAEIGTELLVASDGKPQPARVVALPFYG